MDLDDALAVFGLRRDTTWLEIRSAYRSRIRAVHPDTSTPASRSPSGRSTSNRSPDAAELNTAFATLERVYRNGRTEPVPPLPPPPPSADPPPYVSAHQSDRGDSTSNADDYDDAVVLEAPAEEAFLRIAAALDDIGSVTYIDPEAGYIGALVGDGTGQLVVSLRTTASVTEALFTLEPMDSRPPPLIETVVRAIADRLRTPPDR